MPLIAGSLVGSYRVLAPLGAGGMGEVYRARDEKLNRDIALKVLSPDLASNADHLRRFEQEARAASALNHPNIITIYEIGRSGDTAYIAMELVEGQDLRTLVAGQRLALKNILRVAVKVADALAASHERGIVHRDLKPENVMISQEGFVKILDFGLAKLARPISETQTTAPHTTPGAVFGTVAYMSPEQAAGRIVDFRSDQFSLGVILYELLSGRTPFSEATAAETLAAIIRNDPAPVSTLNESVTPDLQRVIERCLAKDPTDRYAATRDLARDLREIRHRVSNSSEPRHRSDRPPAAPARRMAWIGGAVAAVVLIGAAMVMNSRQPPTRPPVVKKTVPAIAIVPFRDLSGTSDGQIFTDGIVEMIRSRLGESRSVRVIPAFDRAGSGTPTEIAQKLGAGYAVTGAVQRVGNDVHLSVSLIDAGNGEQVAGETLNGTSNDVFGLYNRAVALILSGMNVRQDNRATASTGLTSAADQNAYIEALGLLQRARDEKSVDRAIETLQGLLLNARDSADVNAQLARALLYKSQMSRRPGLIEQATLYAERAAEIDDSSPEIHVRLGQLRNAAGRYADAEREYRRALALRSDNADAYLGLAETSEGMGRAADAEAMYRKAIDLRPQHAATYNRYAVFLFQAGKHEAAAANFKKFTELMPTARGFSNLGAAYQAMGKSDAARQAYEKSIALDPTSNAYVNLADLHYYSGNYEAACRADQRATALAPGSYVAWVALGDACSRLSDKRKEADAAYLMAVQSAHEALAVNPRDAVAHAASARALAKLGRLTEANTAVNTALKINPNDQDVLYAAGLVALVRGSSDVAVGWLQRAVTAGYPVPNLQHDPDLQPIRDNVAFQAAVQKK